MEPRRSDLGPPQRMRGTTGRIFRHVDEPRSAVISPSPFFCWASDMRLKGMGKIAVAGEGGGSFRLRPFLAVPFSNDHHDFQALSMLLRRGRDDTSRFSLIKPSKDAAFS